jgi:hypothetical protein
MTSDIEAASHAALRFTDDFLLFCSPMCFIDEQAGRTTGLT